MVSPATSPSILILSSRHDFACDYVVAQLRRREAKYFRLNSEDLGQFQVSLNPVERRLELKSGENHLSFTAQSLRAVWYRRPVFYRDDAPGLTVHERFARNQWLAFMRNLMVFQSSHWMNSPTATYAAEHKAYQLAVASDLGFTVPQTRIANSAAACIPHAQGPLAVKGLDTVLIHEEEHDLFGYTQLIPPAQLMGHELATLPFIAQDGLESKLDLRVTVVGTRVFCAAITDGGSPISGDWRLKKASVTYQSFNLPSDVADKCVLLCSTLGLRFGAIDLALKADTYFFLEINPTGEWAWLVDAAGLPIDEAISSWLIESSS